MRVGRYRLPTGDSPESDPQVSGLLGMPGESRRTSIVAANCPPRSKAAWIAAMSLSEIENIPRGWRRGSGAARVAREGDRGGRRRRPCEYPPGRESARCGIVALAAMTWPSSRRTAEPRTQKCQSPPVKVGHEHPARPGKLICLANRSIPQLRPVSQALILATGMLVPATDRRGLGSAKESPSHAY